MRQELPEFMLPAAFVRLPALPMTPNGKVDRHALPNPEIIAGRAADGYVAPRTPLETALADIWQDVLGVECVGIHDKFFELGGDSILSIQVIAKANRAGLRLTPKQIFQHQTIAELALVTEPATQLRCEQGLVTGEVLLTPIQEWFFGQEFVDHHHWNQCDCWNCVRLLHQACWRGRFNN